MTPPHVKRLHWGFEDPAKATGTEEEIQASSGRSGMPFGIGFRVARRTVRVKSN